jgi:glycosyltransferase involved in cell wall biosynthesis
MKLLFLDSRIPFLLENKGEPVGGASVRVFQLIRELSEQGHQAGILTWLGASEKIDGDPGFDIVESFRPLDLKPQLKSKIKGYDFFYDRYLMYQEIKQYQPDFIFQICAAINTGALAFIAARLNIPFVFLAASNADADGDYLSILNRTERFSYHYGLRKARLVVCQNAYQHEHFSKMLSEDKLLILPNPFKHRNNMAILDRKQRSYVAWLGNFSPVKNLPMLLQIARKLPKVKFKVAGSLMRTTNREIRDTLKVMEATPNIEVVGRLSRDQVFPFLSQACLLLNTSVLEGFSNTFLESFAVGTPIVTTDRIDPDQIINRQQVGITVPTNEELPDAILKLMENRNYQLISSKCVSYVNEYHDVTAICKKLTARLAEIT